MKTLTMYTIDTVITKKSLEINEKIFNEFIQDQIRAGKKDENFAKWIQGFSFEQVINMIYNNADEKFVISERWGIKNYTYFICSEFHNYCAQYCDEMDNIMDIDTLDYDSEFVIDDDE